MTKQATWTRWSPFALVPAPKQQPPVSQQLEPWARTFDAVYVRDAERASSWPLSATFLNFRLQINGWWLKEQQGKLGNFGLTHRDMLQWAAEGKRVAKFWFYAPQVKAQILSAAEAVEQTIHYAETKHGPAGHPRLIRRRTLSAQLWGLDRLRVAVNRTRRLEWPPFDWLQVLAPALDALPDDMAPAGDLDKTITTRIERFARRHRPRGEAAVMADILANVLRNALIGPDGSPTHDTEISTRL